MQAKKNLKVGALRVQGRICSLSSNKELLKTGKVILTIKLDGPDPLKEEVFKILVPEENAWRLVSSTTEITIVPTRNGQPVPWVTEEESDV